MSFGTIYLSAVRIKRSFDSVIQYECILRSITLSKVIYSLFTPILRSRFISSSDITRAQRCCLDYACYFSSIDLDSIENLTCTEYSKRDSYMPE